jgi:hypothetical protein
VWDAQAVRHIIGGLVVAGHRCHGRPDEIVVQHLSQNIVVGWSDIGQSQVEAGNRTAIHFIVLPVPAVDLDDGGFVTIGIGIRGRATECLGPISGESLDMLGVEAMAERMGHNVVGHHPLMPGASKTTQAVVATRCLEDSLHIPMMTILSCLCKTLTPAGSRGRDIRWGAEYGSRLVTDRLAMGRLRIPIESRAIMSLSDWGRVADDPATGPDIGHHFSGKTAICRGSSFSGSAIFQSFRFSMPVFVMK